MRPGFNKICARTPKYEQKIEWPKVEILHKYFTVSAIKIKNKNTHTNLHGGTETITMDNAVSSRALLRNTIALGERAARTFSTKYSMNDCKKFNPYISYFLMLFYAGVPGENFLFGEGRGLDVGALHPTFVTSYSPVREHIMNVYIRSSSLKIFGMARIWESVSEQPLMIWLGYRCRPKNCSSIFAQLSVQVDWAKVGTVRYNANWLLLMQPWNPFGDTRLRSRRVVQPQVFADEYTVHVCH